MSDGWSLPEIPYRTGASPHPDLPDDSFNLFGDPLVLSCRQELP